MNKLKQIFILIIVLSFCTFSSVSNAIDGALNSKFLVTWTVINTWSISCTTEPIKFIDEYGRETISYTATLQMCYDSETLYKDKEFDTYEEAKAFVDNAKKICEQTYDCGMSDFKIVEINQ